MAINRDEVSFDVFIENEEEGPEGWMDDDLVAVVREAMEHCEWAWCAVTVVAELNGFKGYAYLGGCSYKSEKDFTEAGGYYDDLCDEAYEDLVRAVEETRTRLVALEYIEAVGS